MFRKSASVWIMDGHNEDHDMSIGDRNDACRCDCRSFQVFQTLGGFNVVLTALAQEP